MVKSSVHFKLRALKDGLLMGWPNIIIEFDSLVVVDFLESNKASNVFLSPILWMSVGSF